MAGNSKYLTIFRQGNSHIVDMLEQNTLVPKGEIVVETDFIEDICRDIRRITMLANRGVQDYSFTKNSTVISELKKVGSVLFSQLLPDRIRENLKGSDTSDLFLKLDEHLIYIPWELCYDGKDFLTTKFRIGRQIRTTQNFQKKEQNVRAGSPLKMLIIVDPSETLKYAQEEAESLCFILDSSTDIDVELIGGRQANKMNLISEIDGKDIIHFIGHSFFDGKNPDRSGWILTNGILTSSEIGRIESPPRIVFSNSCQATAAKNHLIGYVYDEQSFGVGGGFLLSGVQNFIGPFWVIHDKDSVRFSSDFYKALLAGASIGQALNSAKENIINEKGWDNLLWASYVLYGDPTLRIKTQDKVNKEEMTKNATSNNINISSTSVPNRSFEDSSMYKETGILKPFLISLSLITLLVMGSFVFYPDAVHFVTDFFSNRFADRFTPVSGPWGYKNGKYTLITDYWDGTAVSYLSSNSFGKFKLEMDIYNGEKAWPNAAFGIIVSSDMHGNALMLHFSNDGIGWITENKGRRSDIGGRVSSGDFLKGRIKVIGAEGHYLAYINGVKLTETHSDQFKVGKVGLMVESRWKIPPGFDNLSITSLEGK